MAAHDLALHQAIALAHGQAMVGWWPGKLVPWRCPNWKCIAIQQQALVDDPAYSARLRQALIAQLLREALGEFPADALRWSHLKPGQNMYRHVMTDSGCVSCWATHPADDGKFYGWTMRPIDKGVYRSGDIQQRVFAMND